MAKLVGGSNCKLDAKFRLSLPAKFRSHITEQTLVVMIEPKENNCLYVFTSLENYEKWVDSLFKKDGGYDEHNHVHKGVQRVVNYCSEEVKIDTAYRFVLDARQRQAVGIDDDKDVVLIGCPGYFELWGAKRWEDVSVELKADEAVNSYF